MSTNIYKAVRNAAEKATTTAGRGGLTYEDRSRLCHIASQLWNTAEYLDKNSKAWAASSLHTMLSDMETTHGDLLKKSSLIFVRRALGSVKRVAKKTYPDYDTTPRWRPPSVWSK